MKINKISFQALDIRIDDIYLSLGYGGACPPADVQQMVQEMIDTISKICKPSYCYVIKEDIKIGRVNIQVEEVTFTIGKVIVEYMEKAQSIALFIVTAGREFENWLEELHQQGDVWLIFLADAIGSEIAEATARAVSLDLEQVAGEKQQYISNSYSPGYCGWGVKEQQKLFSFFPPEPCGVRLTESSLMLPIKSVSGIIALGEQMEKKAYGCDICMMKTCYKKRVTEA